MDLYGRSQTMVESQQKLELFISCRSLINMDTFSKSDPYVIMEIQRNNHWTEYGRTETIMDNLNPNFTKSFIIEYFFEVKQPIRFQVFDYDGPNSSDFIGTCETTLAQIASSNEQIFLGELKDKSQKKKTGSIVVRSDQVQMVNDRITIQFRADKLPDTRFFFWHTTNPFLRFYRLRKDSGQKVLVHETEVVSNSRSPNWKRIELLAQKLCNGDYDMPIHIEVWDHRSSGQHEKVGATSMSVKEMQQGGLTRKFMNNNKDAGNLIVQDFRLIERPTFLDYIQGGTQINLILAVDFTASNQNPLNPSSLHYIDPQRHLNQYQQAILSVGEILMSYDHDKKVPVFGFGCKPQFPNLRTGQTLHCFPLNGNPQDPEVFGLEGIMQTYDYAVRNVQLDGPTYFNPIIQECMKLAEMCKDMASDTYFVLLLLTDGEIHDMKPTINSIVAASHLPVSIIIIGIGNADFTSMEILDDDDGQLIDDKGRRTKRDLVQFVPFNKFRNNPELLAKNVLQELPDQLVEYMLLVNKKPGIKKDININNYGFNQPPPNDGPIGYQQPPPPGYQQPQQKMAQQFANSNFMAQHIGQAYQPQQQQQYPQQGQPYPPYQQP